MKQIVVDISADGHSVKVEGEGFQGPECTQFTAAIEEALGTVENRKLKPEFRQSVPLTRKAGA